VFNLKVDGTDSVPGTISQHLMQSSRTNPLAAEFRAYVELIYKRVSAVKLEAKSEGQDEESNRMPVHFNQPESPIGFVRQQLADGSLRFAGMPVEPIIRVEIDHHGHDLREVAEISQTQHGTRIDRNHQWSPPPGGASCRVDILVHSFGFLSSN
jgi:hypothetical protein